MVNEFNLNDYSQARSYADDIRNTAENILGIFESIDSNMKELYGENWQSSGADVSEGRYQELKSKYDIFYRNVLKMHDHIYKVTASDETADSKVSQELSGI